MSRDDAWVLVLFLTTIACLTACDATSHEADAGPDGGGQVLDAETDAFVPRDSGGDAGGPVCGDGRREGDEECDDANLFPGDGCSPTCTVEPVCGNGELEEGEGCDDGNRTPGDGCSAACSIEELCGNGRADDGEECDDGNRDPGDGCDENCAREPRCGDGVLDPGEECDDGATAAEDGCSPECTIELAECGDGTLQRWVEQCDDGNLDDGDGCSAACTVEGTCASPIDIATAGTPIPGGFHFIGSNVGAFDNGSGTCQSRLGGLDRVFVYTPPDDGRVTVTTVGAATSYDTVLHARRTCDFLPDELACDDNSGGGTAAKLSFEVAGGTPIYIFVDAKVTVSGTTVTSATGTFELTVTHLALAGEGEPCDPAGITTQCLGGLLCGPDETGDHTCQANVDLGCGVGVPVVELTPWLTGGGVTYSSTTATSMNAIPRGGCTSSTAHSAPEVAHRLVLPYDARVGIDLTTSWDAATYVRTACADSAAERACSDPNSIDSSTMGTIAEGTELFIIVDGWSTASGAYTLNVRLERELAEGEPCDPYAVGDRCAAPAICAPDGEGGHTCQRDVDLGCGVGVPVIDLNPLLTETGSVTYSGSTSGYTHTTRGTCTSSANSAPEVVHRLVLPYDAELRVTADPSWDEAIYARTSCTDTSTQLFCSDSPTVSYTTGGFYTAGTELFIFMDGFSSQSGLYPFFLQLRRRSNEGEPCGTGSDDPRCAEGLVCRPEATGSVCRNSFCGDGVTEGSEQCDDGNVENGDGCSAECNFETAGPGGETCDDAVRLNLVRTGPTTLVGRGAGSTVGASADLTGYCSMTAAAPDHVYVFGLAERSNIEVILRPQGGFDGSVYVRGGLMRSCDDPTGEAYCRDGAGAGATETIRLNGVPAGTYYVVVDGVAGSSGSYEVEVRATAAPES